MPGRFSVKIDAEYMGDLVALLDGMDKQARFAAATALTRSAKAAQKEIQEEMKRVWDRPTPWTLKATRVRPATKKNLTAEVLLKDEAFKGRPADKQLHHQVYGGKRELKQSERLLVSAGYLKRGEILVPAAGAKLNKYGNMSRGQMQQILSGLRAQHDQYQNATSTSRGNTRGYFWSSGSRRAGHLPRGVWLRRARGIIPVMLAVRSPSYSVTLDFYRVAEDTAADAFDEEFAKAMDQALATAR